MDCDYPSDSVATLVKPTEYELSRRSIVTTIGCNGAQMTVLKDNESLKFENATLEAMGDLLGTVEIPCSAGSLTFPSEGWAGRGHTRRQTFLGDELVRKCRFVIASQMI